SIPCPDKAEADLAYKGISVICPLGEKFMKNVFSPHFCLIVGLLSLAMGRSFAADSNLYYFEDNKNSEQPTNSGESPYIFHYRGASHQTTEQHKFGNGGVEINENSKHRKGLETVLQSTPQEIHKMSIVVWYRPSNVERVTVLRKRMPMDYISNTFSFMYVRNGYDCMFFNFLNGGMNHDARSSKIRCLISEEWIHLAVTFNEGKVAFYVNALPYGEVDKSSAGETTIQSTPGQNVLQAFIDAGSGSYVDDLGVFFDRALSAEDVEKIYTDGLKDYVTNSASH
ncbi:MAG: LamG-like jellyroll fold domain-containing protein, partial [Chthoniobacterales bacterium]